MGAGAVASGRVAKVTKDRDDQLIGWWTVLGLLVALLLIAGAIYGVLGWNRMSAICTADALIPPGAGDPSWSWSPLGFTCTWDGMPVTKFWW